MSDSRLLVLLGLVLQNVDLLVLALLENLCRDLRAFQNGSTRTEAGIAGHCYDFVEYDLVAFLRIELFNENHILLDDLVLLSAGFNDCKHEKHLTFT